MKKWMMWLAVLLMAFPGVSHGAAAWKVDADTVNVRGAAGTDEGVGIVRDGTDTVSVRAAGTNALTVNSTNDITIALPVLPSSDDGVALGKSGQAFSDAFIASGGVINFNAGDVTLTHSSGQLAVAGASVTVASNPGFEAYNSSQDDNQTGDGTAITVDFDTEVNDFGSDFAADTFTAPVSGTYEGQVEIGLAGLTSSHTEMNLQFITSNNTYTIAYCNPYSMAVGSILRFTWPLEAYMDAGDTGYIRLSVVNGTKVVDIAATFNRFWLKLAQ